MKTYLIVLLVLIANTMASEKDNYNKAMEGALDQLKSASTVASLQVAANQFDRIADVKSDDWLPQYHAAYARVMIAAMQEAVENKDAFLDAAQLNLDAVEKLEHDASERLALQGFLHMIRMSVDPGRGIELGMVCSDIIQKAYDLNKQNPRAVLMLAQFQFGSAQFMGQDTSEACGLFDESIHLLEQSISEVQPDFSPTWGREIAMYGIQQCAK